MFTAWHRNLLELAADTADAGRSAPSEAALEAQRRFALRLSLVLAALVALGLAAQMLCG